MLTRYLNRAIKIFRVFRRVHGTAFVKIKFVLPRAYVLMKINEGFHLKIETRKYLATSPKFLS